MTEFGDAFDIIKPLLPFDVASRKNRGIEQPLFLMETFPAVSDNMRDYDVVGLSGNVYHVVITNKPTCTCPDYKKRLSKCKHIYFVLLRIMKINNNDVDSDEYTDVNLECMFNNIPSITESLLANNSIKSKYHDMKGKKSDPDKCKKSSDDLCPICLDDLENEEELAFCKYGCGKQVHATCINMWIKQRGNSCIFCRQPWNPQNKEYINVYE
jgi:hypothetical protein